MISYDKKSICEIAEIVLHCVLSTHETFDATGVVLNIMI